MNDSLTYVPAVPSTFDPEDSEGESNASSSGEEQDTDITGNYNLRPRAIAGRALPLSITTSDEPSLSAAMSSPEAFFRKQAIREEFTNIVDSGTYKECSPPLNRAQPSGMILKLKRDEHGRPLRFKARLVARGNLQEVEGLSSTAHYSPVACFDLVRMLPALSDSNGWNRRQVDVKAAFLYAYLPKGNQHLAKVAQHSGHPRG